MPRPRKSAALHLLHGTARSTTVTNPLRFSDDDRLKPPTWLSKSAKREFKRVINFLESQSQEYLTQIDSSILAAYCVNFAAWVEAEQDIAKNGSIIDEPIVNRASGNVTGTKKGINPAVRVSQTRQAAMLKAIQALGFDPRSRQAVDTTPVKNDNRSRTRQYLDDDDEDAPIGWRDTY
jgi:P27 family predicted phage terminase small subunit